MKKQPVKRSYRSPLDFVESGFRACWRNAQDLVLASQKLIEARPHAPGLSLAVLALEELGKLYTIDGLLFARRDDHKTATLDKCIRSHSGKLTILELFPWLLGNLVRADPRYGKRWGYNLALARSIRQLKEDGNALMARLQEGAFLRMSEPIRRQRIRWNKTWGISWMTR
jgi:AbiV family abortive infection protein